jgi:tRNA modification GTPase
MAEGGLKDQVERWQQRILQLSARAEAAIDYADEDDVGIDGGLVADCGSLAQELASWLERPRVEPLKDGVRVVVAGPPNAGKSSLINAIAGEERAIVTDVPGTTRDHIEVPLSLGGVPVLLTDTAGLRESEELVERIGIARARALVEVADVVVWLGDPEDAPEHPRVIRVHPLADLPGRETAPEGVQPVSALTGQGLAALLQCTSHLARSVLPGEGAVALNRRQAAHIADAFDALAAAAASDDFVLAAENIRSARAAFDRLTGRAGTEDVIDALFGRFCLGK